MSQVTIKVRENGPLLVTGPIVVQDHVGNTFDVAGKETVALCRCGHSARKPFCDGAHRDRFVAGDLAPPAAQ
jgi:CDGSH-type Zn-finger protein